MSSKFRAKLLRLDSLRFAALVLIGSGLGHFLLWTVSGQNWEGDVSLRKPALFGLSTGVTVLSLSLLWSRLNPVRFDSTLKVSTAIAAVIEVLLISLQYWRGAPSHFNHSTALDLAIHVGMDLCIVVLFAVILFLTFRSIRDLRTNNPEHIAIIHGMLMLTISCVIGFVILGLGFYQQSEGLDPSTFGKAGVMKFPHGMAIHAIQWLWGIAWLSAMTNSKHGLKNRLIVSASYGFWGLLLFSLIQTFSGRARFDVSFFQSLLLIVSSLLVFIPSGLVVLSFACSRFRQYRFANEN